MHILLIDDHVLFREGLALLLQPLVADLVVTQASSCEEGLPLLRLPDSPVVDLVVMDLGLPGMSGMDGIAALRLSHPDVPVVALSSADDRETVLKALDSGAMGFIPKSSTAAVMRGALQLVLARGIYLPPSVFLGLTTHMPLSAPGARSPQPLPQPATTPESDVQIVHGVGQKAEANALEKKLGLTTRQSEVLDLILQGKSAKLICRDLGLAPGTVKVHTSAVLRALNVTTRTQAVVAASRLGWRLKR
jgi:DNA-binding NarL/FixJ family response regulator